MQIRTSTSQFTGGIHSHTFSCTHNTNQSTLGQHFPTADACPLGHMLHTLNKFLGHAPISPLLREGQSQSSYSFSPKISSPRLCFLRATTSPRSSSNSRATLFFLPFLPFFLSSLDS